MNVANCFSQGGLNEARKGFYKTKRQISSEIRRTKRDVNQTRKVFGQDKRTMNSALDTGEVFVWKKKPFIPNSGMIHDYQYVYTFLHEYQELTFANIYKDTRQVQWDSLNNIYYRNIGDDYRIDSNNIVIGWHPHWMGDSYKEYNYKLLSMISYYSYDIEPSTGSYSNKEIIEQLKRSQMLDSASKYGTKSLISVTSFGEKENHKFLNNEFSQQVFIDSIYSLLRFRQEEGLGFDGIDLNFEQMSKLDAYEFTHFVKNLNQKLKQGRTKYLLILDVSYFNDQRMFDYKSLKNHVDYFNVMGYDFNGEHSSVPGPVAPLRSLDNAPSIETAVNDFFNLGISGDKLILSLPLYGITWKSQGLHQGQAAEFNGNRIYSDIKSAYGTEYNYYLDPFSSSAYYVFRDPKTSIQEICWFESPESLESKYDWILKKGIKGVGLWALGYAGGDPQIWAGVRSNFGGDSLYVVEPIKVSATGPYGVMLGVIKNQKAIGYGFLIIACFISLGFVFSLKDWQVREALFQNKTMRLIYSLAIMIFYVLAFSFFAKQGLVGYWYFVLGLISGISIILIINVVYSNYRAQLK